MLRPSPITSWSKGEKRPRVSSKAFVHESAVLVGDVVVEDDVIICPQVVLRADEGSPILIKKGANVQDGVIMHCLKGGSITIGQNCSIAHGAVVHGPCKIGDNSFVGFNAVLLKTVLGNDCFVSHCALVIGVELGGSKLIPPGAVIDSADKAGVLDDIGHEQRQFMRDVLEVNEELRTGYIRQ